MLLSGRNVHLIFAVLPDLLNKLENIWVHIRIFLKPITHEIVCATMVVHLRQNIGQRVLQIATAGNAVEHRRGGLAAGGDEEQFSESVPVDTEIGLKRRVPRLAQCTDGVPPVDEYPVYVKENFHPAASLNCPVDLIS